VFLVGDYRGPGPPQDYRGPGPPQDGYWENYRAGLSGHLGNNSPYIGTLGNGGGGGESRKGDKIRGANESEDKRSVSDYFLSTFMNLLLQYFRI
jgi:hypothetical protein